MDLDELDTAILRELQANARRTNRDVAAAVGVSPTTALDRTRALQERGVIRGALLDVDLAAVGRPVQALIAVRIRPPSRAVIEAFREWVSALPETLAVFVTSGTEDFLIHVAVADNESLYAFVIDRLTQRAEIADVRTSVVYEHLRNRAVVPTGTGAAVRAGRADPSGAAGHRAPARRQRR
ncbi:AsnC family transcriptional regulator [Actinocatenispora thailandica]|uniref:AsnC family transcriptional regulator n=1 Tax=Actinocatenispora thailandica TaxID=227318 RepID=A0A7R7DL86_9ACTN|nr:Lrp/AsnC family transcriptional regulator [Actinocatenispora thailandica]BCJ33422.1 AsnC family transcriptional regulator [Actinocatenispora thailandica]